MEGVRQKRKPYREYDDDDEDPLSDNLAAVNDRLDQLTRQLERMAQSSVQQRAQVEEREADRVADALARLDRRLDQVINEQRGASTEPRMASYGQNGVPHDQHAAPYEQRTAPYEQAQPYQQREAPYEQAPPYEQAYEQAPPYERRLTAYEQREAPYEQRVAPPEQRARWAAPPSPPQPPAPPMPPAAPAPSRGPANWTAQIFARQRALDGSAAAAPAPAAVQQPAVPQPAMAAAAPPPSPPPAPRSGWNGATDLSSVERQLRQINSQISSLQRPYEDAITVLRNDLAEIGRALHDAMPQQAIQALEADVRALAERLDRSKQAGADGDALNVLEHGLAEVRDALRGFTPAENLVGFEDAVHALSHKIDQLAASAQGGQGGNDPLAFKQLEQAVVSLRGIVSNVASDGALAQLAAEVRGLAGQFERAAADSSAEALGRLETRIATILESGRAMPPELEGSIRALSERLDRMQLSQGDQLALVALEDRIAKLSEKLDASDARLRHLDAIERGLADLLVYLEEMRSNGPRGPRAPAAPAPVAAPSTEPAVAVPARAPEPARSPLDLLDGPPEPTAPSPQLLASLAPAPAAQVPVPLPAPPAPPPTAMPMPAATMAPSAPDRRPPPQPQPPRTRDRTPIEPHLPPDTPLEPGSGTPRVKPGSPAARIAASEAALGHAKPAAAEHGGKSAAIAAARNAAKAAYLDSPVKVPHGLGALTGGFFKWPFKKKLKAVPESQPPVPNRLSPEQPPLPPLPPELPASDSVLDAPLPRRKRVLRFLKTLLIAASVAIIVIGAAQTAIELLWPDTTATPPTAETPKETPKPSPPPPAPSRPMPTPEGSLPPPLPAEPPAPPAPSNRSSFFDPATVVTPKPQATEVTGSIGRQPAPPRSNPSPQVEIPAADPAPTGISPALRSAAAANNPAAEYEMGARYADGRGVAPNPQEAIRWFERAANAGFAPAQFRLASLNEKGDGIKKDLQAARRLYIAAADKGHAKAMHNLAVLYAEGIDGKPDYRVAAQWFRKAASFGVADSQYNLAILYARGIGVDVNLAESYKWFALAATNGDADAAKKRDEVGARLNQQTLVAARLAVQTFVPEREPEEATSLRAPPGGWDRAPATPVKPKKRSPASSGQ